MSAYRHPDAKNAESDPPGAVRHENKIMYYLPEGISNR